MKHKLKTAAAFLLMMFLLSIQSLQAQDSTRIITLKEAIGLSVDYSHLLKNNTAKIKEATAAIAEANERRLPEVSVSASYLYFPVQPAINLKSDTAHRGGPKVNQVMYGILNASLPIYTGGKLKYGIESAKYLQQATKLDAAGNKQAVIINTIDAFSNLYKARAAVALVQENLGQSNQRVKDFTNLEKNGIVARNDLLKVSLQSSNIELTLLDAQSNYKIASVNMALMLGVPEQTMLIADSESLKNSGDLKNIEEYEQFALQSRADISALGLRKKAAELGIKSVKTDYYPTLAATAGYIAADLPGFLTITNALNIGVGIKYNLSSLWKTKSKIEQAEARVEQYNTSQDMLNDNVRLQINQAYQAYLVSQKKIEVLQKAVEQATENYRITKNKYDNSLSTTTDLLDADVAQLQDKINVSNATADAIVAYNKLLQAAGLLNN